ncbi:hypothetical protein KFZ70_08700 [Tamlana fucoidanivorans]|uniref:Uncharacterized protein n=1 Tax=Allotamlana fucoidanivorans TaxID=2583814 RepID=A0A5C4SPU7_9FLAO|nr:hypothetical protein [Tamlana fucoidanivorans]TNJ46160.1 hypothetical protein FGF67_03980 [Tamlana fucoidanivorans]
MKTTLKSLLLLPFFVLLLFTSCQEEKIEISEIDESEALVAESELTDLLYSTSIMDGSADNIIDKASCTSVKLPVTVVVNGLEIIIDSKEDFKVIEAIFKEFDDDEDNLEIIFPITVILSNHEEIVIQNKTELAAKIEACRGENEEDEDIECIDFQYPISFSVYNSAFQVIDVITIESDRQLHRFIERVKSSEVFASLNFPVTMVYADGSTVEVNSNKQLALTIREAKGVCDEDDDNDYGDDDFTKERLDAYLKTCPWIVYEFMRNEVDNTTEYREYALNFREEGVLKMRARGGDVLTGTWSTRVTDRGALLKMQFETMADFTLEWVVYDIEYGKIKLFEVGGNRIIMKKNCDVVIDYTKERINEYLQKCLWRVARLSVDGIDNEKEYIGTPLKFFENNVVKLRLNGEFLEGTYEIGIRNTGAILRIYLEGRPNLKLEWLITFLEPGFIKLSNANNKMILERHCPDGDGDINYIIDVLTNGEWEVAQYMDQGNNETVNYEGFVIGFNENGMLFAEGNGKNYNGSWLAYRNEGLFLGLNFKTLDEPFSELRHRWRIKEINSGRIELKDFNSVGEIERVLVLEKRI